MHNRAASRATRVRARLTLLLLAAVSACDVPTKLPSWDQTWLIPGDSTRVSVSELLPKTGELTVSTFGGQPVFALNVTAPATISRSLGQVCSACAAANGTTVPKPAFTISDSTGVTLPTDLVSATVVNGGFTYTITNNFSFDPIRPNAAGAPYGYFVIKVMNGTTLVALDSVDGAVLGVGKNGATLQRTLPLNVAGSLAITSAKPLEIYLTLNSPQGDPVAINSSQSFAVAIQPAPISLSQAQVRVTNQSITAAQTSVDLSSVNDQALALLKKLNVTPEDNDTSKSLTKNATDAYARLGAMSGAAFDKAYAENEVAYHHTVNTALANTLIPSTTNRELKNLLTTGLKIFQGHEQHAQTLASSLK